MKSLVKKKILYSIEKVVSFRLEHAGCHFYYWNQYLSGDFSSETEIQFFKSQDSLLSWDNSRHCIEKPIYSSGDFRVHDKNKKVACVYTELTNEAWEYTYGRTQEVGNFFYIPTSLNIIIAESTETITTSRLKAGKYIPCLFVAHIPFQKKHNWSFRDTSRCAAIGFLPPLNWGGGVSL